MGFIFRRKRLRIERPWTLLLAPFHLEQAGLQSSPA